MNFKRKKRKEKWHDCTLGGNCGEKNLHIGNNVGKLPARDLRKLPIFRYLNNKDRYGT